MKPLRDWDDLPDFMRTEAVRPYYENLKKHERELVLKRALDVVGALLLLVLLAPVMVVVALWVKFDSPGPVFFRQIRVTQYGKPFRIFKFRTMVNNADKMGSAVTVGGDARITRVGSVIRKYRIDEFPQLFNVLLGDMSFVGTRPEVKKYVDAYTDEMFATLLLPSGITSAASIKFKDEDVLLSKASNIDSTYLTVVLPTKMNINLYSLMHYSLITEGIILVQTLIAVFKNGEVNNDDYS